MKTVILILAIVSGLLIFSTTVCGLWIRYSGEADESSTSFHLGIGVLTGLSTLLTLVLAVVRVFQLSA